MDLCQNMYKKFFYEVQTRAIKERMLCYLCRQSGWKMTKTYWEIYEAEHFKQKNVFKFKVNQWEKF